MTHHKLSLELLYSFKGNAYRDHKGRTADRKRNDTGGRTEYQRETGDDGCTGDQ